MALNPLFLGPLLEFGKDLLNRFGPEDKEAKQKAEMEMYMLAANGELAQIIKQLEINAVEAQHASIFVAGWRPFFGWAGGVGFIYSVMLQPMFAWVAAVKGWPAPPTLNIDLLWVVITGMLGIGGLRTYEKKQRLSK